MSLVPIALARSVARPIVWRSQLTTRLSAYFFLLVAVPILLCLSTSRARGEDPAARFLADRGLAREGGYWLLADERQLRAALDNWRVLDKAHRAADQRFAEALAAWDRLAEQWEALEQQIAQWTMLLADDTLPVKRYNQVVRELNLVKEQWAQLRPLFEHPQGKLEHAPLRAAAAELIEARLAAAQAWLVITQGAPRVAAGYESLAGDAQVVEAIAQAASRAKLGPARNYERDAKRLARAEAALFPPGNVLVREEGQLRLGVLLNERVGLVVEYRPEDDATLLPEAELLRSGAELRGARDAQVRIGAGREVAAKVVVLDRLRIGPVVLENVEVVALGAEGRDLGGRLGRRALAEYEAEVDQQRLELRLRRHVLGAAEPAE